MHPHYLVLVVEYQDGLQAPMGDRRPGPNGRRAAGGSSEQRFAGPAPPFVGGVCGGLISLHSARLAGRNDRSSSIVGLGHTLAKWVKVSGTPCSQCGLISEAVLPILRGYV
jgi:hypothetical protein